jgi:hypothetical protein
LTLFKETKPANFEHCTIIETALFADAAATVPLNSPIITMPISQEALNGTQSSITIDTTTPFLPIEFFIKAIIRDGGDSLVLKVSVEVITPASSPVYTTFPTGLSAYQIVTANDIDAADPTRFTVPTIAPPASYPESGCYLYPNPGASLVYSLVE